VVAVVKGFLKIRHSEENKLRKAGKLLVDCNIYFIYDLRKVAKK